MSFMLNKMVLNNISNGVHLRCNYAKKYYSLLSRVFCRLNNIDISNKMYMIRKISTLLKSDMIIAKLILSIYNNNKKLYLHKSHIRYSDGAIYYLLVYSE